jgi:RNA polymerase sigma-70 factor (ECF subfamily)
VIERPYRDERDRLWRSVLFWSGDREVASDAVAEAFAQVLHRGEAIRDPQAWVWRTAFRVAAGELQRRRRLSGERPESAYALQDAPALLASVLARLSPKQRASVVLHHYAGYPLKEVATIIGSTPGAVAVHLHRARARIREAMSDED